MSNNFWHAEEHKECETVCIQALGSNEEQVLQWKEFSIDQQALAGCENVHVHAALCVGQITENITLSRSDTSHMALKLSPSCKCMVLHVPKWFYTRQWKDCAQGARYDPQGGIESCEARGAAAL